MVLMMRVGVSSTVTGAIRRVKSALEFSCAGSGGLHAGHAGLRLGHQQPRRAQFDCGDATEFHEFPSVHSLLLPGCHCRGGTTDVPRRRRGNPLTVAWLVQGHLKTKRGQLNEIRAGRMQINGPLEKYLSLSTTPVWDYAPIGPHGFSCDYDSSGCLSTDA